MEQRTRWSAGHARVAVGCARRHTLEQHGHRAHPGLAIECVDEMDLARPRIGETKIDARFHERAEQAFRTVQRNLLLDPRTKPVAVPIYQTVAYEFDSADHGAAIFDLEVPGNIYARLSNPTVGVLEERVAQL